jgi:hypothetical protein
MAIGWQLENEKDRIKEKRLGNKKREPEGSLSVQITDSPLGLAGKRSVD